MQWMVIIWALLSVVMGINAQESGDLTLISAESASIYGATDHMTLSPDGMILAWTEPREGLCLHDFAIEEATCTPFPNRDLEAHTALRWSPDSTTIAITENWLVNFNDADLWLFDVETRTFTNRTDDDVRGSVIRVDDDAYTIDVLPTWNPVTGDLYFFRYRRNGSPYTLTLYRIRAESDAFAGVVGGGGDVFTNTPEAIHQFDSTTFTGLPIYNGGTFAFEGGASISPDGAQLAVLVRPVTRENRIITLDLENGIVTETLAFSMIDGLGLPEWYTRENRMVMDGITWSTSGDSLLISTRNEATSSGVIETMVYQLDLASGDVTPLFDFSDMLDERTALTDSNVESPRTALLLPDSDTLLYFNFNRSAEQSNLSSLDLNTLTREVVTTFTVDDFIYSAMTQTSVGASDDIVRVLIYGYLFTFER